MNFEVISHDIEVRDVTQICAYDLLHIIRGKNKQLVVHTRDYFIEPSNSLFFVPVCSISSVAEICNCIHNHDRNKALLLDYNNASIPQNL